MHYLCVRVILIMPVVVVGLTLFKHAKDSCCSAADYWLQQFGNLISMRSNHAEPGVVPSSRQVA